MSDFDDSPEWHANPPREPKHKPPGDLPMLGLKQLWTIVRDAAPPEGTFGKAAKRRWCVARCVCGTEAVRSRRDIEKNRSRSCGCESRTRQRVIHAAFVAGISKAARARSLVGAGAGERNR